LSSGCQTGRIEFDLLCALVRPVPDLMRARKALRAGVDFPIDLALAAKHGVRPRLIEGLGALSWDAVPATARTALEGFRRRHCARVLSLLHEVRRLDAALAESNVRFALFKGPALAAMLYGDPSAREYDDIDVVVPRAQYADAELTLAGLGYRGAQGDSVFRRAFLSHLRQYVFVHPDVDAAIDLHWDFSGAYLPFPLAPEEIWGTLEPVRFGNCAPPAVAGPNLALLLAGHGTKEAWRRLQWVCDFAWLVKHRSDLDWSDLHRRARARRCGDCLLLAFAVARGLLDTAVPDALVRPLEGSTRVLVLAAALVEALREGRLAPERPENFGDLGLCDNARDRLKAVLELTLAPTVSDYNAMPLPRPLWPVYHATRPFRLAAKALTARRRPGSALY